MLYAFMDSPLGRLTVACSERGVGFVHFGEQVGAGMVRDERANREAVRQLEEYFDGRRRKFELELDIRGATFQTAVWRELLKIPYGKTRTYGEIAARLGNPGAARAVGMANHDNRIAIIVPCHRVIGANGSLTGYAGGLHLKQGLLELEGLRSRRIF